MARNGDKRRIEPSFGDSPEVPYGLRIGPGDRIMRDDALTARKRKTKPKARGSSKTASRRRGPGLFRRATRLVYWTAVLGLWGVIALAGVVAYYGAQMPSATDWAVPDRAPNIKIVSTDGQLLANRGATGGESLTLAEMSPFIPQAVIAIEDRRFRSHWGVDPLGLARASVENLVRGRVAQGGSTLTQQLAKNLFLKPDRTIGRKVQEALLALWLEQQHSKDEILEMYLNRVYFGSGAYGVEAASRRYFNKSARDVTLGEAAMLAGLLKAPSRLSPARDPKAAEERAQVVLGAMREEGMVSDRQLASAMSAPAVSAPAYWTGSEQYVADRVMDDLTDMIGEPREDLVVEATVDLRLQKVAEDSIRRLLKEKGKPLAVSQGALVSIDGTGAVRALVGGADYAASQFDRATEARRQPGSAFKPFVYLAALEAGETPDSVRDDAPVRIGNWSPSNYKKKYRGAVTLTTALAESLNSVAAQLAQQVGPQTVIATARRLGITSTLQPNVTIALGTSEVTPLELTAAYVPFANGGLKPEVHLVARIRTAAGRTVFERRGPSLPRVVSEEKVGMMNTMMQEAVAVGTARNARLDWPSAGKTGTTQNARDAWFVGYTANLTTGVWFGNDDGRPMKDVTGGSLPTLAWHEFMAAAHEGLSPRPLPGRWNPFAAPPAIAVSSESGAQPALDRETSGSIDRPVPPADIGGPKTRAGSLLERLFGR
ncbi:MAG: penicillin-binding protein [Methylobacterium mesophilicum]|nr:penicillin-binding protein [Methylobacterium mesophilicum]